MCFVGQRHRTRCTRRTRARAPLRAARRRRGAAGSPRARPRRSPRRRPPAQLRPLLRRNGTDADLHDRTIHDSTSPVEPTRRTEPATRACDGHRCPPRDRSASWRSTVLQWWLLMGRMLLEARRASLRRVRIDRRGGSSRTVRSLRVQLSPHVIYFRRLGRGGRMLGHAHDRDCPGPPDLERCIAFGAEHVATLQAAMFAIG